MEQLSPLLSIPAGIMVLAVGYFLRCGQKKHVKEPVRDVVMQFRLFALAFCTAAILLWFSLPQTAVLSTFGYPGSLQDISTPSRILEFLQSYNRAIVRSTQIVYWLIFLSVFWPIAAAMGLARVLTGSSLEGLRRD